MWIQDPDGVQIVLVEVPAWAGEDYDPAYFDLAAANAVAASV
jgi:hypothetical protein